MHVFHSGIHPCMHYVHALGFNEAGQCSTHHSVLMLGTKRDATGCMMQCPPAVVMHVYFKPCTPWQVTSARSCLGKGERSIPDNHADMPECSRIFEGSHQGSHDAHMALIGNVRVRAETTANALVCAGLSAHLRWRLHSWLVAPVQG